VKCLFPRSAWRSKEDPLGRMVFVPTNAILSSEIKLPCGQCINCRLERARQWAIRCVHEASLHDQNCFITLTYSNENLPHHASLVKRDLQLFLKKLRKKFGSGIRFYGCGEYGERGDRPHYHACLFNFNFPDREKWLSQNGNTYYISAILNEIWGKGWCTIGDVTFESAAYCAKYIMKKITGERAKAHYGNRIPEFTQMSRGSKKLKTGGIGKNWFDKYSPDIYNHDIMVLRGGIKMRPPKYYDKKYKEINPTKFEALTLKRKEKIKKQKTKKTLSQIIKNSQNAELLLKNTNKRKTL